MEIVSLDSSEIERIWPLLNTLYEQDNLDQQQTLNLAKQQTQQGKLFLIAKKENNIVGLITMSTRLELQCKGCVGQIDEFIVHPDHRKQGVGTALMTAVETQAKKQGLTELHLYSTPKREHAWKLYEKRGFTTTSHLFWKKI